MRASRRLTVVSVLGLVTCGLIGCHYYEEFRVLKSTADVRAETAELLRAYRLCLEKYEDEPQKAREHCAPYTQTLRDSEIKRSNGR